MDFRQLRSFTAVVEYQSFSKAADYLNIAQPTISTHIRQLEEELGGGCCCGPPRALRSHLRAGRRTAMR